jgi:hypothetical protein
LKYDAKWIRTAKKAHQQAKKLAAQNKRARQLAERKRIKKREADERKAKGGAKRGPEGKHLDGPRWQ